MSFLNSFYTRLHDPELGPRYQLGLVLGLALGLHMLSFAFGSYAKSYDAYTHMFLSSHWYHSWWLDFEPRWYTGFSIHSYPPFAHQMVALAAFVVGLEPALVIMMTLTLLGVGVGMYRYTRIWFAHEAALIAAGLVLLLPGLTMTTHLFGQYPNLVNLALTLNLLPYAARWLQGGRHSELLKGELLLIAAACTSLFSNFLGVFFFVLPLLFLKVAPGQGRQRLLRLGLLLFLGVGTLMLCLLPFLSYIQAYPVEQVSIPHGSRGNVLALNELNYFTFYGLYGFQLLCLPLLFVFSLRQRAHWGFAIAMAALFLFSLGGATELNRLIFRDLFDVLTFDRFAFWNDVMMTPLLAQGLFFLGFKLRHWSQEKNSKGGRVLQWTALILVSLFVLAGALINMASPFWKPLPRRLDVRAIAQVLEAPRFEGYRYLTLGLGSYNLSGLSTWSSRQTLDGNYNLARRLPELNDSPIGQLDDAKYYGEEGINTIAKLLLNPAKYHLKYVLLGDLFYTPLLQTAGWYQSATLPDGLMLWQSSLPVEPMPQQPEPQRPLHWRLFWGILPWSSFFLALLYIGYEAQRKGAHPTPVEAESVDA